MADVKVTGMPSDASPTLDDLVMVVDTTNGENRRVTLSDLITLISNNLVDAAVTQDKLKASCAFLAYLTSTHTLTTGTATKVNMSSETYDVGGDYDATTNYRFTAPVDGYYLFGVMVVHASAQVDTSLTNSSLYKNGAVEASSSTNTGGTNSNSRLATKLIHLVAGDYVEAWAQQNNGVNKNLTAGVVNTYWYGALVAQD